MRNSSKVYTFKLIFKRIGIFIKYNIFSQSINISLLKKAHLAVL